jgi:hypothetical protein
MANRLTWISESRSVRKPEHSLDEKKTTKKCVARTQQSFNHFPYNSLSFERLMCESRALGLGKQGIF